MRPPAGRALPAAIFLLSAAALAYEVLLMRLLSISLWHHFAYMVISLALLGYGASGTLIALLRAPLLARFPLAFGAAAALFSATSLGCFALGRRIPFNPLELVWDPRQTLLLGALYLLLAVPFFCAGTAIGLALARFGERIHRLYRADLMGAGAGAVGVIALLFALPPATALRWLGGLGLAAAAVANLDREVGGHWRGRRWAAAGLLAAAVALPLLWPPGWSAPAISEFKGLPQALRVPGSRIVAERSSPLGLLDVVASPEVPFRHAPGLSLAYPGSLPGQLGLFTDAEAMTAINVVGAPPPSGEAARAGGAAPPGDAAAPSADLAFLDYLTAALPYHLLERPEVLVLGAGGGGPILSALHHGAAAVTAVELDPLVVELVEDTFGEATGRPYSRPGVRAVIAEARGVVTRSEERYDLVALELVDSFAAASAGVQALSESYLYTVEALAADLDRLSPGGLLAVTRWLAVPPREELKLFATAVTALERRGVAEPGRRLAWIRSWNTSTLLVKNGELTAGERAAVRAFCEARSFDLAYLPGMAAAEANRFNLLPQPYFFEAARALLGPGREDYFEAYKFYIRPATDDRPYFFRSFKWATLPELARLRGRGGTPMIQWSYLIVVATLLQAALAAAAFILLPVVAARRRVLARPGTGWVGLYFLLLGLAFLFVEIAMIQRFSLFLAHPIYAVAAVLGSFLVFAGLGSGASRRLARLLAGRRVPAEGAPALAAAALATLYLVLLPALLAPLAALPLAARLGTSVLVLAPLAFFMGMPFPLGLDRARRGNPEWVPWAWAVNGCASVLAAVLATLLAIHLGFAAVIAIAALLYAGAALILGRF